MTGSFARENRGTMGVAFSIFFGWVYYLIILILFLLFSLGTSIVIEWIGSTFIWDAGNAQRILIAETAYLDQSFYRRLGNWSSPAALIANNVDQFGNYLSSLSIPNWYDGLAVSPNRDDSHLSHMSHRFYKHTHHYFDSAFYITLVFITRLGVVVLSVPIIVITVFVWAIDGLAQREIRKACAGRDTTTRYNISVGYMHMAFFIPFFLYLSSPVTTHPNVALVPMTLLLSAMVYYSTFYYKKYW